MNAMVQIHFGAPVKVVNDWVDRNALRTALSSREQHILTKRDDEVSEQEAADLFWYIEALWALVWVGSLISDIPLDKPVGEELASFLPNLKVNETPDRLRNTFRLRAPSEIYRKLDLHYLAHWYARDGNLRNYDTSPFVLDVIMERRKALEWVMDAEIPDWDSTPEST